MKRTPMPRTAFVTKAPNWSTQTRKPMSRVSKRRKMVELATDQLCPKQERERFTPEESAYNTWIHAHCTCCITGHPWFEIAHTGRKYMSLKSPLDTCLPLIKQLHMIEEGSRLTFWNDVGLPDYAKYAKRLFAAFKAGESPDMILQEMHGRINQQYVATLLGSIDF